MVLSDGANFAISGRNRVKKKKRFEQFNYVEFEEVFVRDQS